MNKLARIIELSRLRAREGHLGLWRQFGEMGLLRILHGVGPGYYHLAGFWRRELSWGEKTGHLSAKAYRQRIATLNPAAYRKLSQNKIPEKAILSLFGIPTPRFLGQLDARMGREPQGQPLRHAQDLERLICEHGATRLVFKPLEGWGGKGVHIPTLEKHPQRIMFRDPGHAELLDAQAYCKHILSLDQGSSWIVEQYLEQHPLVAAINPASVNTVRIWVIDRGDRECRVLGAFLRIGRKDMVVDNTSSGGIVAPIDPVSGMLHAAREAFASHNLYPRHPDHGAPIADIRLPHWPEVKEVAMDALSVFPGLRFAGLDVAIGVSGPVVLELNVNPDREGAALFDCPNARALETS